MSKFSTHEKTLKMVQIAFLAAVEVVLTLLYIPIGTINLNFGLVPIVMAGILLGPAVGGFIGAVSGIVTMIQVFTTPANPLYVFLVSTNPLMASLLCIVKTGAAGLLSGLVYKLIIGAGKNAGHKRLIRVISSTVAAVVCPVVNTGIFVLGMFTVFGNALKADPVFDVASAGGLAVFIFVGLVGLNFFVELISTVVITPPLNEAVFASKLLKK